jgi:hypothetical protein
LGLNKICFQLSMFLKYPSTRARALTHTHTHSYPKHYPRYQEYTVHYRQFKSLKISHTDWKHSDFMRYRGYKLKPVHTCASTYWKFQKPLHQRKQLADANNKTVTNCNYDIYSEIYIQADRLICRLSIHGFSYLRLTVARKKFGKLKKWTVHKFQNTRQARMGHNIVKSSSQNAPSAWLIFLCSRTLPSPQLPTILLLVPLLFKSVAMLSQCLCSESNKKNGEIGEYPQ